MTLWTDFCYEAGRPLPLPTVGLESHSSQPNIPPVIPWSLMRAEGYFESSNLAFACLLFLMFSSKFLGCKTLDFWIENTKSLKWSDVTRWPVVLTFGRRCLCHTKLRIWVQHFPRG